MISILVPARNEAVNLPGLLNSIVVIKDVHYEVIILDDNSDDGTFQVVETFANLHPGFRVIKGGVLPSGWTGKNYACWQLAQVAKGDYFLFVDADVQLKPEVISSALYRMSAKKLALLSLFSKQKMHSLGERLTVPLMNYLLLTLLPIRLIADHPDPIFSAACGQFMLFSAPEYRRYQWHRRLAAKVAEDLGIMKALKQCGLKGEGLMAGGLMSCRMYTSFSTAISGFAKNFIAPFNDSLWLFIPFVLTIILGPLLIIADGNSYLIAILIILTASSRIYVSLLAGERCWLNVVLHPLQMLSFLLISCIAVTQHLFKSSSWKGRRLDSTVSGQEVEAVALLKPEFSEMKKYG